MFSKERTKVLLFSQKAFAIRTNLFAKRTKKTVLCLLTAELKGSNTGYILEDAVKTLV